MPIYEYRCRACAVRFETLARASSAPAPACPKCGSADVVRLVSTFATEWKPSYVNWHRVD